MFVSEIQGMRKIVKIAFFPLVMLVRAFRKCRQRPLFLSKTLFAYDCRRFVRFAGGFHTERKEAALAQVIMAYHVLEKGLTMPHRHLDFGHASVLDLMDKVRHFEERFGTSNPQVNHAVGCIKEYLALHTASGFDKSKDPSFWTKVQSFCDARPDIPCAKQMNVSSADFYAHNESPFPQFAASRHTSRHYDGPVGIEQVKKAVELAMTAPSACNRQFVKVHCVSNHGLRDKILSLQNGNRGFGKDADKLLVVTADLNGNRWPEERNDLYTNAGIFIMNLCYALHYGKIAHCILNWSVSPETDRQAHALLNLGENEAIAALLTCGRPPAHFLVAASPRKTLDDVFSEIK